jgi:hypothetical protein
MYKYRVLWDAHFVKGTLKGIIYPDELRFVERRNADEYAAFLRGCPLHKSSASVYRAEKVRVEAI